MRQLVMMAAMTALSACTAGAQDEGMVLIKGGTFQMGSPASEPERDADETLHEVTVADFMMYLIPPPTTRRDSMPRHSQNIAIRQCRN